MAKSKHHHWVPQFYLRNFSLQDVGKRGAPKIWVLTKQLDMPDAPTAIRNVAGRRYLYAPEGASGVRDWSAEEFLGNVESAAASVWSELTSGKPDLSDPVLRETVARFVGLLHLRNVAVHTSIDKIIELRTKLWGPLSDTTIAQLPPDAPDPTDSGRFFASTLMRDAEKMTSRFSEPHWIVVDADRDVFITSDRPVVFLRGGGPGRHDSIACVPIGPRRALMTLGDRLDRGHTYGSLPLGLNETVNAFLFHRCIRHVYSGRPINEVVAELQKVWLTESAEMTVQSDAQSPTD